MRGLWPALDEPLGMRHVGGRELLLPLRTDGGGAAEMHDGGREKPQSAVAVRLVVPGKEDLPKRPRVLDRSEPRRKLGTVLERFELGFRRRIVVRDVGPAVRPRHAEIGQQQGHGLTPHRAPTIRVEGQLARLNAVLRTRFGDEALGQPCALMRREHPADNVTAEDVEDHVQIEVGPLDRAEQLGNVPAPDFVGPAPSKRRYIVRGEQR